MSTAVATPEAAVTAPAEKKRKPTKKILLVVLVLLAAGGAAYWFVLKPGPTGPQPGTVAPLDSIQINLADGHYLRLGLALQLTKGTEEVDGSKALDAAIGLFSGEPVAQVDRRPVREKLRTQLDHLLEQRYDGEVMDVYFTEFVTQ